MVGWFMMVESVSLSADFRTCVRLIIVGGLWKAFTLYDPREYITDRCADAEEIAAPTQHITRETPLFSGKAAAYAQIPPTNKRKARTEPIQ
jgi:hypothetical protein